MAETKAKLKFIDQPKGVDFNNLSIDVNLIKVTIQNFMLWAKIISKKCANSLIKNHEPAAN